MNGIYFGAVVLIAVGVGMLAFPKARDSLNRFGNQLEGVETNQGETYRMGQIAQAVMLIIFGIVLLFVPGMID